MLTASILDPRTDPEPPDWAPFVAEQPLHVFWRYDMLRLEGWMSRHPARLGIVRDGSTVVAAMAGMVCQPWLRHQFASRPRGRTRALRPRWVEVHRQWLSGIPSLVFRAGLDATTRRAAIRAFERALARHIGVGFMGAAYRMVYDESLPAVAAPGRVRKPDGHTMVLCNRWSSADGWLAGLSRERRRSVLRYGKRIAADPTLVVRTGAGRDDLDAHELARLLDRHRRGRGLPPFDRRTPEAGIYLDAMVRRPDVHTLTYHDADGTLLAFNTLLDHPHTPVLLHWASVPVDEGGRHNLYFDCYLRAVRHMIDHDRPELLAGRGLNDIKRSLDFEPRALTTIVVPRPLIGR
jgi:uncharacterized protein